MERLSQGAIVIRSILAVWHGEMGDREKGIEEGGKGINNNPGQRENGVFLEAEVKVEREEEGREKRE
jgi:hypothetical protein